MATQVTVKLLTEHLEKFGWKYYQVYKEMGEKEGGISTSWRTADDRVYRMTIDPIAERNCVSFKVLQLAQAPWDSTPPEVLRDLLTVMAWVNHDILLGKFCYDIRSGEVLLSVDIPTDDSTLTYTQFEHTMHILLSMAEKWSPRLQALLRGEQSLDELILARAGDVGAPEEFLAQLRQALQRRQEALQGEEPLTEI